jgi:hypothetical protein
VLDHQLGDLFLASRARYVDSGGQHASPGQLLPYTPAYVGGGAAPVKTDNSVIRGRSLPRRWDRPWRGFRPCRSLSACGLRRRAGAEGAAL